MPKPSRDIQILSLSKSDRKRFWRQVDKSGECWLMLRTISSGHGIFYARCSFMAHRVAKIWQTKKPMLDHIACHLCTSPNCVRPSHIYWGSNASNSRDRMRDGTSRHVNYRNENHTRATLANDDVKSIWIAYGKGGVSTRALSKKYGVTVSCVNDIVHGYTWKAITSKLPKRKLPRRELGHARGAEHPGAKLSAKDVGEIRDFLKEGVKGTIIAKRYKVSSTTIYQIRKGNIWNA